MFEKMVNILPYIDNIDEKISGLVGSSLGGTILDKPYRRPDIMNLEGVFDSKYMQQKANDVAITDLKEQSTENKPEPESQLQPDIIIPNDSAVAKMLDQNNITDVIKVSPRGLAPEVLFPPNAQPLPTAPENNVKNTEKEQFVNVKEIFTGVNLTIIFLLIFIVIAIILIIKYCK
jgi:hypothetical protein